MKYQLTKEYIIALMVSLGGELQHSPQVNTGVPDYKRNYSKLTTDFIKVINYYCTLLPNITSTYTDTTPISVLRDEVRPTPQKLS